MSLFTTNNTFVSVLFNYILVGFVLCGISCTNEICDPSICENGGKIRRETDSCYCKCPENVEGRYCEDVDECLYLDCKNGGYCIDGKCNCPEGYTGIDCSILEDPCKFISCDNQGICINGECSCPDGYYGEFCQFSTIEDLIGTYTMTERCKNSGIITYSTSIYRIRKSGQVAYIDNIGNLGQGPIKINVGSKGILIPNQPISYLGVYIKGSGDIYDQTNIAGSFRYYDPALEQGDQCSFKLVRKK